ncbi:MAG: tRNA (guanosine(46)-N7)-methyltransferase TrmB [Planctomycetota bacterium]|nr:tRNA (guanosine(46)-N7)-methyltransferase TrmB [Planctomycetota bacterium]
MSFGLGRGRKLEVGDVGLQGSELPPLPDDIAANPASAWLDPRAWFADPSRPFELEIGSGKGTFLVQQAEVQPDTNFLGIEWAGEFYAYAADRVRRRGLGNVKLLHADATEFLHWRMPSGIVRVLHLYFSDPWPKSRHHKRRVVQDRFLEDVRRVLIPGGELRIVTDHDEYWQWMERHFARWAPPDGSGPFAREPFERPASAQGGEIVGTNFERKYSREGRPFHAAVLRSRA